MPFVTRPRFRATLVENDSPVRRLAQVPLERCDYRLIDTDCATALERWHTVGPASIDLLLTVQKIRADQASQPGDGAAG